jgi:aminoglycoside phosphotransferase (APT) family kinase protein
LTQLAVRRDRRLIGICERVGGALAQLHAEMRLPDALRIPLPASLASEPADECALHGDLNGSNVGYDSSTDRVVILDWSAAPALRVAATVGSRYFDVVWFTLFFFRFRPGTAIIGWSPERWAGAFLAGYAAVSGTFSADALRAYHERARTFLSDDYRAERARRGRGIPGIAYGAWQRLGVRRFEKFLAALSDPPVRSGDAP